MVNETLEQLPSMSESELWNIYRDLFEEQQISKEDYLDVKWGLNFLPFDFVFYLKYNDDQDSKDEWIKDMPASGRVRIGKKKYHIHDYLEEIDRRKSKMRRLIKEALDNAENKTEARYN